MRNPLSRISLLWKIMLSTSVAITLLFAVTGWLAVKAATRATTQSINHEVQASFEAYQSLWKARADRLSSISSILSAMSDVRGAFRVADRLALLSEGKIVMQGTPQEFLDSKNPKVREFLERDFDNPSFAA